MTMMPIFQMWKLRPGVEQLAKNPQRVKEDPELEPRPTGFYRWCFLPLP